jgi:hypothetical protein
MLVLGKQYTMDLNWNLESIRGCDRRWTWHNRLRPSWETPWISGRRVQTLSCTQWNLIMTSLTWLEKCASTPTGICFGPWLGSNDIFQWKFLPSFFLNYVVMEVEIRKKKPEVMWLHDLTAVKLMWRGNFLEPQFPLLEGHFGPTNFTFSQC